MATSKLKTITLNPKIRKTIEEMIGKGESDCFQCEKCTNGCPITFAMDIRPHKLVHLLQLGLLDEVLYSDTIRLCTSCQICTIECPNGIDVAHLIATLRQLSRRNGIKPSQYDVPPFHSVCLSSIKRPERVQQTEMTISNSIEDSIWLRFLKLLRLGFGILKGKIKLRPKVRQITI